MLRAILRFLLAIGGAAGAAVVVGFLETRAVVGASEAATSPGFGGVLAADLGVLLPVVIGVGCGVALLSFLLEPEAPGGLRGIVTALRGGPMPVRLRTAAVAPLTVLGAFVWCVAIGHVARAVLAVGKPAESGLTLGAASVGLMVVTATGVLALAPSVRRMLAVGSESAPFLLDPAVTGGAALALALVLFGTGVASGDLGGTTGVLGIFGVLKRPELDLRPVANAAVLALGAYVLPAAFARSIHEAGRGRLHAGAAAALGGAMLVLLTWCGLCVRASSALGRDPLVARGIEKEAPLGKIALAGLRRLTDRDKDGYSARFGGGDCDDRNPKINPGAIDVPGNGIDEDCSGADTPAPVEVPVVHVPEASASPRPRRTYNVLLFTVDTLRIDLGFLGYPKPVSPNLDKLAEHGTVFERAYSMASYTGKSVGPMLIGRYPSETVTDFSHFNTYAPANVFTAERARDAGVRTFAGMCHWYFKNPTGLKQGFDIWDTSAMPPGMSDNDTSISSDRLADLALKLLADPGNVTPEAADVDGGATTDGPRRFFAWFHFFDPHAQYVAHEGAPDFVNGAKSGVAQVRALYDQEVWFTDKHIGRVLDYVASQPWGEDTAIVITADHGEAFGEHNMTWHGAEIWEELVRVPLLVYVPGAEPRRVPVKRSHIDVAPTILDLLGVPGDERLRGRSLLADVFAPNGAELDERDVYIDMPKGPFNGLRRAIITGTTPGMKLVHQGGATYQLFDLEHDALEKKDVAADRQKLEPVLSRMQSFRSKLEELEVKAE